MQGRVLAILLIVIALNTGVVAADTQNMGVACPEDGNPSQGLNTSVLASDGRSLNAVEGVNQAFENVGCDTRLPT